MTISRELSDIIVDPLAYQQGTPVDEAFTAIRRDQPFARADASKYDSFWVVSRHADVMEIEKMRRCLVIRCGHPQLPRRRPKAL